MKKVYITLFILSFFLLPGIVTAEEVQFEDDSTSIRFTGTWNVSSNSSYSGGTIRYSTIEGVFYEFDFQGDRIELYGLKSPPYGQADIYLDGELVGSYDGYSSTSKFQELLFALDVTPGSHTLKVYNPYIITSGTNGGVNIDFIKVYDSSNSGTPPADNQDEILLVLGEIRDYQAYIIAFQACFVALLLIVIFLIAKGDS